MTDEDFEEIMKEQNQYIEELEAELAECKYVASAIDTQWALSQDEIADLKAELVKAKEALECAKLYIESITATTLAELTGGKDE